ncbi:MAG: sulfite exporter TauE/SafE family protein [Clostridia bacterium]|nr:sulfite exporter TauE/SafE family protein [Clostridia bacterium]
MFKKICIGILAGFISGFFGTGGGMILVPAFIHLLKMEDKKARATSVLCVLPMVVTSGIFYYKNNYIDWKIGALCAIGGIIGGYIGAKLLKKLNEKYFKIAFIVFLVYTSVKFIIKK